MKFANVSRVALGGLALGIAWTGFQLATHRHTGILRTLAEVSLTGGAPPRLQHSVHLSWKASTSAVAGYNVYRRDASGFARINPKPVADTSYVDRSVEPGQTYHYVTKAVTSAGTESGPSNEVQAVVPSP